MRDGAVGDTWQRGHWSVSRVSRWSSTSFDFVGDGAPIEPRSLGDFSAHPLLLAVETTVCEPCVTLVQCHIEHQWKPRGGVRTVDTWSSEVLSARIPSATV